MIVKAVCANPWSWVLSTYIADRIFPLRCTLWKVHNRKNYFLLLYKESFIVVEEKFLVHLHRMGH